ncbi:NAD(P)-binding protein [Cutaneotrichosporon oleaginosum]|uniref:D-xylose 1-dehydrogenase (NADP(+), D-xylono-1,5-lactone-forming) n=1 Tax=Cutaneotrichosporon oleaginosum TaxID=879819 RepID=A0A0J0XD57_9TREE|nr:NAD(P)-binding protein [Cutaneotrichosporon oleaginosum]KLT38978.1 NAD(P)-binding protein [Cutaneotrichosporon oleaginosum]TXT14668.1 hypothetical protein COLE_00861 [Cutaneotrichosporon oleaginosum]
MTFTLRWGIIATGGISTKFAEDLFIDPATRESDVAHKIAAVGSRSVASAQKFIDRLQSNPSPNQWGEVGWNAWGLEHGVLDGAKAYGSYDEVFADANVDAVYIGTPHTFHHANAKAALLAGKHVLCEKPFTFDLEELDELIKIAKEKNLFLMEAVWTRFHPIAYALQDLLKSGRLGKIKRMSADFSMNFEPDTRPDSNRMVDPEQGGGSLLDQGPYPSVWAMLALHQHPDNTDSDPRVVASYQKVYERSGVDAASTWVVSWKDFADATLVTDMTASGFNDACAVITCEEADVALAYPPWRPERFTIVPHASFEPGSIKERETNEFPATKAGGGMHYEADEVARCIRDGKTESERMPLAESRITQRWLDDVRKAGGTVLKDRKSTVGQ